MRRLGLSLAVVLPLLALAAAAHAIWVQEGNLRVSFEGSVAPRALPRDHPAPVTVRIDSSIGTTDGSRPPRLSRMSVAVNRAGRLSLAGLPACPVGALEQRSTEAALAACRPALIGHGAFDAEVDFSNTPLIPAHGRALAFNGRVGGKPALLLHIYIATPVRVAIVLPFRITRHAGGKFGAVLSTRIPRIASDRGYVTAIRLTLGRRYTYRGQRRSVFSASCAAPAGFPGAIYELARATFSFDDGRQLSPSLTSDCRVR
jgi:hypothetical protein